MLAFRGWRYDIRRKYETDVFCRGGGCLFFGFNCAGILVRLLEDRSSIWDKSSFFKLVVDIS